MSEFKPALPYSTPIYLLNPSYETVKGVPVKKYPDPAENMLLNCSFKTYGGTETTKNDLYSVIDTAIIETWFRPDVKSDSRIMRTDGAVYEVLGEPENINMRNQFIKFKVRRVKGGA